MSATFFKIKKNRGITLIETIIYMVILTFVMGLIVQMLVSIGGMYRQIKITRETESSGAISMERMLKEIRNASDVVEGESVFGTSPGALTIAGTDENDNSYKTTFDVSDGILRISKNNEPSVALISSSGQINYLLFRHLATTTSEAVRVEMEISGMKFYGFAILRGSY